VGAGRAELALIWDAGFDWSSGTRFTPSVVNRRGVEKLHPAKFAEIKLRRDALQTSFLVFWTFSTTQFWPFGRKLGFFNTHRR
jgi:hypothetical protein